MVSKAAFEVIEGHLLTERVEVTERNLHVIRILGQMAGQAEEEGTSIPLLGEWYEANKLRVDIVNGLLRIRGEARTTEIRQTLTESVLDFTELILDSLVEIAARKTTTSV